MRGVHWSSVGSLAVLTGSSPHARGPLVSCDGFQPSVRFIPACAGSTPGQSQTGRPPRVHPRMRGVHTDKEQLMQEYGGSSPHARGPHRFPISYLKTVRFIPACAGSTGQGGGRNGVPAVHPRMRGVHPISPRPATAPAGSSPHARGPLGFCIAPQNSDGFIPACAGSTPGVPEG